MNSRVKLQQPQPQTRICFKYSSNDGAQDRGQIQVKRKGREKKEQGRKRREKKTAGFGIFQINSDTVIYIFRFLPCNGVRDLGGAVTFTGGVPASACRLAGEIGRYRYPAWSSVLVRKQARCKECSENLPTHHMLTPE